MGSPVAEDMRQGKVLDGKLFEAYTHCVRQGDIPHDLWDFEKAEPKYNWKYVGWCPSGRTCIPNSNWPGMKHHIAVLLENDQEEQVWLHVPVTQEMLDTIKFPRF